MLRVMVVLTIVTACGRTHFDALGDGALGAGDTSGSAGADECAFTFCDDFDRDGDLTGSWSGFQFGNSGTGTLSGNAFVVTIDTSSDFAQLGHQLPAPTTSVTFGMRLEYTTTNAGADCELDLVRLQWDSGACTPFGVNLGRDGQTSALDLEEMYGAPCAGNVDNPTLQLENTGPHDYVMTLTLGDAATSRVTLAIDGNTVVDKAAGEPIGSAPLSLQLGASAVRNIAGTWTFTYDNVYIDVQ